MKFKEPFEIPVEFQGSYSNPFGMLSSLLKIPLPRCAQPEFVTDNEGRFRWPEQRLVEAVPAVEGSALVFSQDLPHEGEPVLPGSVKYLIRTDVMYERVDKVGYTETERATLGRNNQVEGWF